ncbi:DUF317 domain-containing protein [Streptomyces polygonati]|uniref:DUF317 domain-containing protein n=1 Tax=Streptomyces polygonati TaxID=1617087 RepID=A0ABV8HXN0_9ACTN
MPVYAAGAGDHEQLLNAFFDEHREWQKYRPHDETTIANHEDLALRLEFVHETHPAEPKWTIAAYESPVGERLWHATATAATPIQLVACLLNAVAWHTEQAVTDGPPATDRAITETVLALVDEGWKHTADGHGTFWTPPDHAPAGLHFDAFTFRFQPSAKHLWTVWGGNSADHPAWAIHLSPATPASILQELTSELAEGKSLPEAPSATTASRPHRPPPAIPGLPSGPSAARPGR